MKKLKKMKIRTIVRYKWNRHILHTVYQMKNGILTAFDNEKVYVDGLYAILYSLTETEITDICCSWECGNSPKGKVGNDEQALINYLNTVSLEDYYTVSGAMYYAHMEHLKGHDIPVLFAYDRTFVIDVTGYSRCDIDEGLQAACTFERQGVRIQPEILNVAKTYDS